MINWKSSKKDNKDDQGCAMTSRQVRANYAMSSKFGKETALEEHDSNRKKTKQNDFFQYKSLRVSNETHEDKGSKKQKG